jgi:hypothetical protein
LDRARPREMHVYCKYCLDLFFDLREEFLG